jgi:hypothetical protein
MPILSYFVAVGSVLVALLFVADATLDKRETLPFNTESAGMPKPWHAEPAKPEIKLPILAATPAPAPDMTSAAVRAAAPPPTPHIANAPAAVTSAAAAARAEAVPEQTAKLNAASKKPKQHVVRRAPRPDNRQNYAWSPYGGAPSFGGNSNFGRF